jgi:hypothetical protein
MTLRDTLDGFSFFTFGVCADIAPVSGRLRNQQRCWLYSLNPLQNRFGNRRRVERIIERLFSSCYNEINTRDVVTVLAIRSSCTFDVVKLW